MRYGIVLDEMSEVLDIFNVIINGSSTFNVQPWGSRHLRFATQGTTHKKDGQGGHKLVVTKGYGATAATSTLFKLLATQKLRQGDGLFSTPASRRADRLFGKNATGRSRLVKLEFKDGEQKEYCPELDTCLDAFVRLLESRIASDIDV